MSLADDVRALRALNRILPLLTKLGELSPEECREVQRSLEWAAGNALLADDRPTWATHRTAAEVFKMLGGGR